MSRTVTEFLGDERSLSVWWYSNDELIDFTGATFVGKLWRADDPTETVLVTKTVGFTGSPGIGKPPTGTPNLLVEWVQGDDLSTPGLTKGLHIFQIIATINGADRTTRLRLEVLDRR